MTPRPSRLAQWCLYRLTSLAAARVILDDIQDALEQERGTVRAPRLWVERQIWAYILGLTGLVVGRASHVSRIVIRDAWRAVRSTPRTSLFILGILTLAISTATVTFSVVDAIVLRPLPFERDHELVVIEPVSDNPVIFRSATAFESDVFRQRATTFDAIATTGSPGLVSLPDFGAGRPLIQLATSASLFDVLRVPPLLGRLLSEDDERVGAERVAVISHGLWRQAFAGDPTIVNRLIGSGNTALRIVGVLPPGVTFPAGRPEPTDLWVPLVIPDAERIPSPSTGILRRYSLIGRMLPGVSPEQAQADIRTASLDIEKTRPGFLRTVRYDVRPVRDVLVGEVKPIMLLALWAVVLVTGIACVNVANVALTRASGRAKEMALRASLGAGRAPLITGLLAEGVMLSLCAGVIGLGISLMTVDAVRATLPQGLALSSGIAVNGRVFVFALIAAVMTGVGFTIAPAIQASRADLNALLKQGAPTLTPRRQTLRTAFLVAEVAIVTVLLISAVLVTTSFVRVTRIELGFGRDGLITAPIYGFRGTVAEAESRFSGMPGVASAAVIAGGPPPLIRAGMATTQVGPVDAPEGAAPIRAEYRRVSPAYFRTVATPILRGRGFTADDRIFGAAIILDEECARAVFGSIDVVGRHVKWYGSRTPTEVVGVVANIRIGGPELAPGPQAYLPLIGNAGAMLVVRAEGTPQAVADDLRALIIREWPAALTAGRVELLNDTFRNLTANRRASAVVMSVFGVLALVISLVGVYGVVSAIVAQQAREFGVRMALGATGATIMRQVLTRTGRALVLGGLIGLPAAAALARTSQAVLFDTDPLDPLVYALVGALLCVTGLAASLLPARRAGRVDPLVVLRSE